MHRRPTLRGILWWLAFQLSVALGFAMTAHRAALVTPPSQAARAGWGQRTIPECAPPARWDTVVPVWFGDVQLRLACGVVSKRGVQEKAGEIDGFKMELFVRADGAFVARTDSPPHDSVDFLKGTVNAWKVSDAHWKHRDAMPTSELWRSPDGRRIVVALESFPGHRRTRLLLHPPNAPDDFEVALDCGLFERDAAGLIAVVSGRAPPPTWSLCRVTARHRGLWSFETNNSQASVVLRDPLNFAANFAEYMRRLGVMRTPGESHRQ